MIDKILGLWALVMSGWALVNQYRIRKIEAEVAVLKTEEKDAKINSKIHSLPDDDLDERIRSNLEQASKSDH